MKEKLLQKICDYEKSVMNSFEDSSKFVNFIHDTYENMNITKNDMNKIELVTIFNDPMQSKPIKEIKKIFKKMKSSDDIEYLEKANLKIKELMIEVYVNCMNTTNIIANY